MVDRVRIHDTATGNVWTESATLANRRDPDRFRILGNPALDINGRDLPPRTYEVEVGKVVVEVAEATVTPQPLDAMTVAELRELAEQTDVDLTGATRKADILAAFDAATINPPADLAGSTDTADEAATTQEV